MTRERDLRLLQLNHPEGATVLLFDSEDSVNPFYHFKGVVAVRINEDGETEGLVQATNDSFKWTLLEALLPVDSKKSYDPRENEASALLSLDITPKNRN